MKKAISKNLKTLMFLSLAMMAGGAFTGCQDDVDQSNRFTFTGELISSYLENRPEKYSHFVQILNKSSIGEKAPGSLLKTLSTYGTYTCIAPTNEAVERFVLEQYEKYHNSVIANEQSNGATPIINTGVTSPYISDLSVEKCTEIARNHIIENEYQTVHFRVGNNIPTTTMNNRYITVTSDINPTTNLRMFLFEDAPVIEEDINTYNGTIHAIDGVLNPSTENASEIINDVNSISIFSDALKQTGLTALLSKFEMDKEFDETLKPGDEKILSTEPKDYHDFPKEKKYGFTLLIEPNAVLLDPDKNHLGKPITSWEDLAELAENVYGPTPAEYATKYTHPKNSLFKYMAYHIIDRSLAFIDGPRSWMMELTYENVEGWDDGKKFFAENHFPTNKNWHDYFETYLPYNEWEFTAEDLEAIANGDVEEGCMLKVSKAYTDANFKQSDVVLNYCNVEPKNEMMQYYTNIRVIDPKNAETEFGITEKLELAPQNAGIFLVDKILVYNEQEMRENIINERMRWDIMSCFPELTTNHVRYNVETPVTCIPIGIASTGNDKQFSKRLRVGNNTTTQMYYLHPWRGTLGGYTNFLGDEMLATGNFDFQYRIPHVPAGTYEIRMGFSMAAARGIVQFYLDDVICGIPVDMRNDAANINRIGWFSDYDEESELTEKPRLSESEIQDSEKALRNRGFMKAPASVTVIKSENNGIPVLAPMRDSNQAMRRILATNQELIPDREGHWIRVKDVTNTDGTGSSDRQFNQDYLEIVPKSVYNNPSKPEDRD